MTALDYKSAAEMLRFCADAIIRNKPFLTEVDAKIGDGDHGIGMALGMTNAKNALQAMTDCRDIYKIFSKFGTTMIMSMGGASGVIFGTMFMGGAKGKEPADSIHSKEFANMMKDSLSAIKARGKAEVGDKTMVDALEPLWMQCSLMEETIFPRCSPLRKQQRNAASSRQNSLLPSMDEPNSLANALLVFRMPAQRLSGLSSGQ